jgi:RHS repeat-associated protein
MQWWHSACGRTGFASRSRLAARPMRLSAAVACGALVAMGLSAAPATGAQVAHRAPAPKVSLGVASHGAGVLRFHRTRITRAKPVVPVRTGRAWPSAGTAVVDLAPISDATVTPPFVGRTALLADGAVPGALTATVQAGPRLPVLAGRVSRSAGPSAVDVALLSHRLAAAARVRGVVFTARTTRGQGGKVRLGLNYASFADVSGGNYGFGLGLEELPACALTTPSRPACRKARPLASVNDPAARTVSAVLPLPGAASARTGVSSGAATIVLAATDTYTDGGGSAGTYNATALRPSGTWSDGGSSGSFTYSYPMAVPPSPGGLAPKVGLDYDSDSVDGQTAQTQVQSTWVGDGWSTPQSYIAQSFIPCQDDPEGSAAPESTQDECYDGPVLTLSLNGTSTPLVCPVPFSYTTTSTCTAASDNGEVVTHHVNSGNGQDTQFTDYWTVTTRDGTTYSFGLNHLPGWASGDPATNSVQWEPVFSAHSGDPCYDINGSSFADSSCPMAYQWNLDYVTDVNGNAMAYFYDQSANAYDEYGTTKAASYVRDAYLDHVFYGFTSGNVYGSPADEVVFGTGDRCFAGSSACDPLSSSTASNWDDVPYVQDYCASGSTSCSVTAPTFWSTVALTSVSAEQWNGSKYVTVDSWALQQKWSQTTDGTEPTLWLQSITRTGSDSHSPATSGSSVSLPSVTFGWTILPNRVDPGTYPALDRDRIATITTETGSVIQVSYEQPDQCSATSLPTPSANTSSCFPVYWGPFTPSGLGPDWYIQYAVASVAQSDPAGGSPGLFTSYSYAKPAWHYDDNEVVQPQYRTYGQWRGYEDVKTFTGSGTDPAEESEATYYQGMADDNNSTAVNLTDSQNGSHPDLDQLAGDVLESTTYAYDGGPVDDSQIYSYWVSPAVASRTRTGLTALTANFTGQVEEWTRQALTDTATTTWRETETDTSYDTTLTDATAGLPLFVYSHGDLSQPSQETCTQISYAAANTSLNLVGLVSQTQVDAAACAGSNPDGASAPGSVVNELTAPSGLDYSTQVISDTRTFYDDATLASTWPQPTSPTWPQAAPGNSEVSVVQQATGYSGGAFTYQTKSADLYNSYGLVTASYDGNGGYHLVSGTGTYSPTTTSYTLTDGSVTQQVVTNPLGQSTTTTFDPERGLPVTVTDPNGITATFQYDELGRLTSVWEYGRATTAAANLIYSYDVSDAGPTVVTTEQLNDAGGYVTSTSLYDSLLRLRQTQVPTPQGGILVTDHFYDSLGLEWKTNNDWWDTTASPGSSILTIPDSQVPDQTVTEYDGVGRAVEVIDYDDSAVRSTSYTLYTGDKVTQIPPTGGTPTTTVTDALGRTTELDSWTTAPTVSVTTNSDNVPVITLTGGADQATTDSYNTRGELSAITDVTTGETWTRTYNQLGQVNSATTQNAGTTSMTYDFDGNVLTSTDQMGHAMTWAYDALSRPVSETDTTTPSAPKPVATWAYDNSNDAVSGMTDPIGQLTTATSYDSAGNAYTVQQTGFNAFGESTGEKVSLPTTTSLGALSGTSYTYSDTYTAVTGQPLHDVYPASSATSPALPAETVVHGYSTAFDLPSTLSSNLAGYTQNTTYTAFSQVAEEEIGSTSHNADITNTFDPNTGALTNESVTNTAVSSTPYDSTSYAYDPSGNITAETDVRNGTEDETQCFDYDLLDRLTQAWTTDSSSASSCPAGPSVGSGGTVGDGIPGGEYWTSWTYNALGDQTSQTQYALTSGGTNTVTTYTDNDGNGTGSGQPDTLTSAATTGPSGNSTATYTYNADGDTTARDLSGGDQSLTWNDNGTLAADATTSGTTSYVYDTSGDVLVAEDPGLITLYLPGEQIYAAGSTVTGSRFLTLPGGGQVVRTGSGTSYDFEVTDQHGTSLLTLNNECESPIWRQETPFGAPRGTATGTWPDTNGYLGMPTDSNSGLTIVGARQYDPTLGRFISPDPVFDAADPQSYNGYTYAADNPATNSDPSGLRACSTGDGGECQYAPPPSGGSTNPSVYNGSNGTSYGITTSTGGNPPGAPGGGILPSAARPIYASWMKSNYPNALPTPAFIANAVEQFCDSWVIGEGPCGTSLQRSLLWDHEAFAAFFVGLASNESNDEDSPGQCGESFTPGTRVLLADGKTVAISKLRPGDKVLAWNTRTRRNQIQNVAAVLVNHDHDLYDLTIRTAHGSEVIHTTSNHRIWDQTRGQWVNAGKLVRGDRLHTPNGPTATVVSGYAPRIRSGRMWDLTVPIEHDFYVQAASTAVLVHNDGGYCGFADLQDGGILYHSFETPKGTVELIANVSIDDTQVVLSDFAIFGQGMERGALGAGGAGILLRELRTSIFPELEQQGYTSLRITGVRVSGPVGHEPDLVFQVPGS